MQGFKTLLTLVFLSLIAHATLAQRTQLSGQAEIIVMTMSPGQEELYSAFGHSAVRVRDDLNRLDIVFNYGIFDFDQPNFYLNFTKGKLLYKLGTAHYSRFLRYYMSINRTITEQTLNLSPTEKQEIFDFLTENAKPENADYYYNYCYNNCATKIRDVIEQSLDGRVQFNYSYANDSLSYRDLMDQYLGEQPWGDLGIDFCLGSEIDRRADGAAYMYMPEYLEIALDGAQLSNDSTTQPLVKTKKIVNKAADQPSMASPIRPFLIFVLVFFFVGLVTHRSLKYQANYRFVDVILFGSTGVLGISLLLLWFGTDHLSQHNYNLIWCTPLNLIALILLLRKKKAPWLKYYFNLYGFVLMLQVILSGALPQQLHEAFIPLVLALMIRSFYLGYWLKGQKK
ncbi:DUF4105 domain-containing protein [Reichenbachiella agariperforans]|uniref:lipoprotein N-acyltransferase Lnb domain-containing protein n=1 Tax=Reichenbachiella agariperforans TaxID=156994 RepID=UPI001C09FCA4|nr:DUF4105 domain-containing protein [Reichenbachiella agariperforans]MBU2914403.1 DUF4105 domain-containing protein [Reichenbachiella agariperforans]